MKKKERKSETAFPPFLFTQDCHYECCAETFGAEPLKRLQLR